jgi:Alpha-glucosidases, family 31 of glycosyl hydrolases
MKKHSIRKLAQIRGILILVCSLLLLIANARAATQPVGNITQVAEAKANRVVLETSSLARVSIEFFDLSVIRVRVAPSGVFERNFSYAIDYSHDRMTPTVKVSQTATRIVLANAFGTKVVVNKAPFSIEVFDETGKLVVADDTKHPTVFDKDTGEISTSKLLRGTVETFYGFGEKAFAEMSRDGKYIANWNTDTFSYPIGTDPIYESIPFFYALYDGKAYGVFFNNTFRTYFDMAKTSPERYTFGADGGELDYFVFTGGRERSPKKIMEDYAALTGTTHCRRYGRSATSNRDGLTRRKNGFARLPTGFAKTGFRSTLSILISTTWTAIAFLRGTKRDFPTLKG